MLSRSSKKDASSGDWKLKYNQIHEDLKRKERDWVEAEELLRRTIRRLTIAANGVHPVLDKRLASLRDSMGKHLDLAMLKDITASMPGTLMELSKETEHQLTPTKVLMKLSDELENVDSIRKQAKKLKAQLSKEPSQQELEKIVSDIGQLVSTQSGTESSANSQGDSNKVADTPAETPRDVNLINVFVSRLDFPEIPNTTLKSIQARSAEAGPEIRKQLAVELTELLNKAGADLESQIGAGGDEHYKASDAITLLIEFLSFPESLSVDVDNIRERLERPLSEEEWPRLLKLLANLIERAKNQVQQQKNELESFLSELTDHLEIMELNVLGLSSVRDKVKIASENIQKNVTESVDGIHHTINNHEDIEQLRQSVFNQLDGLREHVRTHQQEHDAAHAESEQLVNELTMKLESMENEANVLRQQVKEQHIQATIDPLTKTHNRLAFDERINVEFARWKRDHKPLSLVIWDADHFKLVNDTFGHLTGDDVLKHIANILQSHLRESDFVARYGGEEFIMLLPGADTKAALVVADTIRKAIEFSNFKVASKPVPVTMSAGICEFKEGDTPEDVFSRADDALYEAKRLGRNRCQIGKSQATE